MNEETRVRKVVLDQHKTRMLMLHLDINPRPPESCQIAGVLQNDDTMVLTIITREKKR